jgi:hypothetical protein
MAAALQGSAAPNEDFGTETSKLDGWVCDPASEAILAAKKRPAGGMGATVPHPRAWIAILSPCSSGMLPRSAKS